MYLFNSGRVTLIKSSLSNLPMYFFSLFPILVSVANCIEKLYRDFLWDGFGEKFKYHLVSWSKVYSPISERGLGIQNLRIFNRALLGKSCDVMCMRERLGGKLLYMLNLVVIGVGGVLLIGVRLWKNIRRGWSLFCNHTRFELGDGSKIRF
jgi:hypothetical protein